MDPKLIAEISNDLVAKTTGPWEAIGLLIIAVLGVLSFFIWTQYKSNNRINSETEARKYARDLEQQKQDNRIDEVERTLTGIGNSFDLFRDHNEKALSEIYNKINNISILLAKLEPK